MINKVILSFCLALLVLCGISSAVEFSADQVMKVKGMQPVTSKLNFTDTKWRMESRFMGRQTISIIRADRGVSWVLMPAQKMFTENKLDNTQKLATGKQIPGEIKREKIGRENINGINCDKLMITYKDRNGTSSMFLWLSNEGIPMKSAASDASWTNEMKNVKKGSQPSSLFEIPEGYKKMAAAGAGNMPSKMDMDEMKKMIKDYK